MTQIQTVALIGASGNLGVALLPVLRQHFHVTVITRASSKAEFPQDPSLTITKVQDDYPVEELTTAFQNIDAVVCAVAPLSSSAQFNIIDASLATGVKHYIPAEFGLDSRDPVKIQTLPALAPKAKVLERLASLGPESTLSWTGIATGLFFDWGLRIGFLKFDLTNHKAEIVGDGNVKFSATPLLDIANAVVGVLRRYNTVYRNKYIFIQAFRTSPNEVLEIVERVTGQSWDVHRIPENEFLERAKRLKEDGKENLERFEQVFRLGILYCDFEAKEELDRVLVKPGDVEEVVRKVLQENQ